MTLSTNTLRRLGASLTLTAAIAGVAAPATLANHQDVGVKEALKEIRGTAAMPDAVERSVRNHQQSATSVECDAVCRYLHNHVQGVRLITDTLGGNGGVPLSEGATSRGFSWPAAAIGAATGAGSLVVLFGGTLLVLRRRSSVAL